MIDLLDDFVLYLKSERGLSKHTIAAYHSDCYQFIEQLKKKSPKDVDAEDIIDFLAQLEQRGYASSSITRALISLKVFYRFLKREGIIHNNPAYILDTPKVWQLIPEVLTYQQVCDLLAQPNKETATGARDLALLELMYGSGLRVSEVCALPKECIYDGQIKVVGKGNKERMVPVNAQAIFALNHYVQNFRKVNDLKLFNVDRTTIWRRIKKYALDAGILQPISPHTLRHSFATHLLDNGGELRVIQELLGHATIQSTGRYLHMSRSELQSAFNACHPRLN